MQWATNTLLVVVLETGLIRTMQYMSATGFSEHISLGKVTQSQIGCTRRWRY